MSFSTSQWKSHVCQLSVCYGNSSVCMLFPLFFPLRNEFSSPTPPPRSMGIPRQEKKRADSESCQTCPLFFLFSFPACACSKIKRQTITCGWFFLHNGCRSYWRDYDTALFILKHLYHDIPEDPDEIRQPNKAGSSENQRKPAGLICQTEAVIDEDLPLTFSDRTLIREFSRKVRKSMRIS